MLYFVCLTIVVAIAAASNVQFRDEIIRPLLVTKNLPEVCLVFIQGAEIKPYQYKPLIEAIQEKLKLSLRLWVGIPEFLGDMAEPLAMDAAISRVQKKMSFLGMNTSILITAGHSQGGAIVQLWAASNPDKVNAQILLGSFLTRAWKKDYIFHYNVPTLTIGGELDGLARVTRISEAFYTQLLDDSQPPQNALTFPVTVIEGLSHMQFADGEIPETVFKRDLKPEISYADAHAAVAYDIARFLELQLLSSPLAKNQLLARLNQTQALVDPIIKALHFEGYHNFRPPCLCPDDTCQPMANCTASCPFTSQYSQNIMGSGLSGLTIKTIDSFHDVWETEPTVHLPKVMNSCSTPEGCELEMTTITQAVYHTGEDLEVWKLHFDIPELDTGFFPISAVELRTKMTSRQSVYTHAGVSDADFDELDGGSVRCAEINQQSWEWAKGNAGSRTMTRFSQVGQPFVMGPDIDVCPAGPCWIWKELNYNRTDVNQAIVRSPQFSTETDFWLPKTAGFHYCKVLSPARAIEWIYVDGLRAKYSLLSDGSGKK